MKRTDRLINFACYENGKTMLGVADVTLPEISFMTETIKGAGIAGEIDMPTIGQVPSMTVAVNFTGLMVDNLKFLAAKTYQLDFRGSMQTADDATSEIGTSSVRLVMKGVPKKTTLGVFDTGAKNGNNTEFEVTYLKLFVDGKEFFEVDKLNFIYKVDGVDYLAKVRTDLGM